MPMIDPTSGALVSPEVAASAFVAGRAASGLVDAMLSRRSVRAFKSDPVPREVIADMLALASRAPSGTNIQPWRVHVLTGAPLESLKQAMLASAARAPEAKPPYNYYPVKWFEPFLSRRRALGWDLYGLLGIGKADRARMAEQHARNFLFFDAPVGLVFTIARDLELGSWLDYGMFMQNVMLAARAWGLDTCPQAAIVYPHEAVRRELELPDDESLVCGMALGYARADAPENTLVTPREPVSGFAAFRGFGPT